MSDPRESVPGGKAPHPGGPAPRSPASGEPSLEELIAQADALAAELGAQLYDREEPLAHSDPAHDPTPSRTVPQEQVSPPDAIEQVRELDEALAAAVEQIGTPEDLYHPAHSSPTGGKLECPESVESDADAQDPRPASDRRLAASAAAALEGVRTRFEGALDALISKVELALDVADRPFQWVPERAKLIIGHLAVATLITAVVTLIASSFWQRATGG